MRKSNKLTSEDVAFVETVTSWWSREVEERVRDYGWNAYLVTFMFNHIPGGPAVKLKLMQDSVSRFYSKLITKPAFQLSTFNHEAIDFRDQIADSIRMVGLQTPITVYFAEERIFLVTGLHRLEAMKFLGKTTFAQIQTPAPAGHFNLTDGKAANFSTHRTHPFAARARLQGAPEKKANSTDA